MLLRNIASIIELGNLFTLKQGVLEINLASVQKVRGIIINMNNMVETTKYRIGVDLGGTSVKIGIVDNDKKLVVKKSVKTSGDYVNIIKDMGTVINELLTENNIKVSECASVGVGSPGLVDFKAGKVIYSCNLDWHDVELVKELRKYIDLPVFASNDANCAAYGETLAGAASGCDNAIMVTLGTGVGGGIIIDGKVFEGANVGATELGHTVIAVDGEECACGRRGCFEAYSSATALIRETKKAAQNNPNSLINKCANNDIDKIDGKTVFDAAELGDVDAKKVIDEYIKHLGEGILNLVNTFRPDKIILGGGVSSQGENLTVPLQEYITPRCYAADKAFVTEIVIAKLGNDAGIIGAAFL